jgi:alpha-galactosidase
MTLRPERKAIVRDVFDYPAMDETVPLDVWKHAADKADGFELILARKGRQIYLGIFNWSDAAKEYNLPAFGKDGVQSLEARHSTLVPYAGKLSFDGLCRVLCP